MNHYEQIWRALILDSRYQRNLDWGEPRPGHPEGTVRKHIADLERNLEVLRPKLSDADYWRLKILIHCHDIFKGEAEEGVPIKSPRSHASLAKAFLSEYCDDADLLAIVQYHDEPFALWRQFKARHHFNQDRLEALFEKIKDWPLFLTFVLVDNATQGKSREPVRWFFELIAEHVTPPFSGEALAE